MNVSKGYQKIRKINQPATIPHGDVIKEHSALRFEGKERCIEGATAGARSKRRRCLCLDRRLDKERKDKRGTLAIGEGDKRHVGGCGIRLSGQCVRRFLGNPLACYVGAGVVMWSMVADSKASASPHLTPVSSHIHFHTCATLDDFLVTVSCH